MTDWKVYLVVVLTGLCLWRAEARLLRLVVVGIQLVLLGQHGVFLSNVGRNTFERVERGATTVDTFHEGVFAEAKAADAFARAQLPAIYIVALCLGGLALWPTRARRGASLKTGNSGSAA